MSIILKALVLTGLEVKYDLNPKYGNITSIQGDNETYRGEVNFLMFEVISSFIVSLNIARLNQIIKSKWIIIYCAIIYCKG